MTKDPVPQLTFTCGGEPVSFAVACVHCVGFSGRDRAKVLEHIEELRAIGVPTPDEVPVLYPMRRSSLIQCGPVEVMGDQTSGEAELVLLYTGDSETSYLTLGSDHTDRALEAVDIGISKQVCDKPIADTCWRLAQLLPHWDRLVLRSEVRIDGRWTAYQHSPVSAMLPLDDLLAFLEDKGALQAGGVYYLGTVPLRDGFRYGDSFRMWLEDPVLDRNIICEYPIVRIGEVNRQA